MSKKKRTQNRFTPEIRDRAIRMVMEQQSKHNSQWAAIELISEKIGCSQPTLHSWIKKREVAKVAPESLSSAEREQLKQMQRENKELKTANEILRKASAFFAGAVFRQAELDRRPKRWWTSSINIVKPMGSSQSVASWPLPHPRTIEPLI